MSAPERTRRLIAFAATGLTVAALGQVACKSDSGSTPGGGSAGATGGGTGGTSGAGAKAGGAGKPTGGAAGAPPGGWLPWPGTPPDCVISYHPAPASLAGWEWSECPEIGAGCRVLRVPTDLSATFVTVPSVFRRADGKAYVAVDQQVTVESGVSGYWINMVQADGVNVAAWRVDTGSGCNFQVTVAEGGAWLPPYRGKQPFSPVVLLADLASPWGVLRTETFGGAAIRSDQRAWQLGDWLVLREDFRFALQRLDTTTVLRPKVPGYPYIHEPYLFQDGFLFGASVEGAGNIFKLSFDGQVSPASGLPAHARSLFGTTGYVFYSAPGMTTGLEVYSTIDIRAVATPGGAIPDFSVAKTLATLHDQSVPQAAGGEGWMIYQELGPPTLTHILRGDGKRKRMPPHPDPKGAWSASRASIVDGRVWIPVVLPNPNGGYSQLVSIPIESLPDE